MNERDTIFSLSSGSLPSGVAVIRLSGPKALEVNKALTGANPVFRQATLVTIRDRNGFELDQALALTFRGPNSFTGENVVEWHCHGGIATVNAVLDALGRETGLRLAEAGEFSRRSFENGKMDFTQLEGLSDLISAKTEEQRKQALSQSRGSLQQQYDDWRVTLIKSRALIEAELDFSDEDDIPDSVSEQVWGDVLTLKEAVAFHLADNNRGEITRNGFRVALTGPPNAGKSSLMNALAKRDIAIVTDQAGTTRDVLEVELDIGGHLVRVFDTAGIRESEDIVEAEGIKRAKQAALDADLVLWLQPSEVVSEDDIPFKDAIVVTSKSDLLDLDDKQLSLNVVAKDGLSNLMAFLQKRLSILKSSSETVVVSRQRQRRHLETVLDCLNQALDDKGDIEIRSEELRLASESLARITGRIDVEDLLDVIFTEFCVGK